MVDMMDDDRPLISPVLLAYLTFAFVILQYSGPKVQPVRAGVKGVKVIFFNKLL